MPVMPQGNQRGFPGKGSEGATRSASGRPAVMGQFEIHRGSARQ